MSSVDVHTLALEKVGKILGPSRSVLARKACSSVRARLELASTADLQEFGESLTTHGGIEQAVGALLMVQAVLIETAEPPAKLAARAREPR